MDRNTIPGEEQAVARSRLRRIWQRIVGALACVVVFVTTYALILPAITMEKEAVCGIEEHSHGEECFDPAQADVLLCTLTEHSHSDACRETPATTAPTEMTEEPAATEEAVETVPEETTAPVITVEGEGMAPVLAPIPETIIEEGYLANAAGEEDAIHWKVVEEDDGTWTLKVEGHGDIPDFSSYGDNLPPWSVSYRNSNKIKRVVVGDEITCIGNSNFTGFKMEEATIGKAVKSIGGGSFYQCYSLKSITIPGNVEVIESSAFYNNYALTHVEIENGVKRIEPWAFLVNNVTSVYIPESVEYIGGSAFTDLEEYIVSENNPYFKAIDGVLYSYDLKKLVDYPGDKHAAEYVTPDFIDTVQPYALGNVRNTPKLRVTSNVKNMPASSQFGYVRSGTSHNWEEIYIEDGVPLILNESFCGNFKLKSIRLPETPEITSVYRPFSGCTSLETVTLTKNITNIHRMSTMPSHVVYDIADCKYSHNEVFMDSVPMMDLEIGPNVDTLSGKFNQFVEHANSIQFHGENWFTVADGMFASAKSPLNALQGNVYVDAQGVVYTYDAENQTAAVLYVQPGVQNVTIPKSILTEDGQTECVITTVKQNALVDADGLTTLTFASLESITAVEAFAFANCTTLINVNGQTTVEGAEASFTNENLTLGYEPFYNTGLTNAPGAGAFDAVMDGEKALTVTRTDTEDMVTDMDIVLSSEGGTMAWEAQEDGSGGYRLLTNDTLNITGIAGDPEGNQKYVYRIYLRATGKDCVFSISPGITYGFDGVNAVCQATEDPYTIYLEFTPEIGSAVNVPVTAVYPSPKSPGGGLTIWGAILSEGEAEEQAGHLIEAEETVQAMWTVVPDPFKLTKTATGSNPAIVGYREEYTDEAGQTQVKTGARPGNSLSWQIKLFRDTDTTSAYGKDYIKSVDFTDTVTFPEGISWRQEVLDAVKAGNTTGGFAGDIQVASISQGTGLRLSWDEENQKILIHWRAVNTSSTTELGTQTIDLNILPQAVEVGMNKLGTTMTITNQAEAVAHYHHSEDAALKPVSATKTISGGQAKMQTKLTATGGNYFGEDVTYTTTVYNNGASPWTGDEDTVYHARFEGSANIWITPENLERMFSEHPELTVEITDAALGTWTPVTGTDGVGNSAWIHPGNSDVGTDGHSLTITKTETGYRVVSEDGTVWENTSLEAALWEAGYAVTQEARYFCTWPLNGEGEQLILNSGQEQVFKTYATYKNTFQILKADLESQYGSKSVSVTSEARVPEHSSKASATTNVYRDAVIGKSTRRNGLPLSESNNFSDGDVLEYHLDFTHYGTAGYEDLPMVDQIYGSHYLLVQKVLNPGLDGLREHGEYYVLTPGTYQNVVVGVDDEGTALTAASVTVTAKENDSVIIDGTEQIYTGLHTTIKWYFPDRKAEEYLLTITYQTLVDFSAGEVNYTIGNVIWMNDHTGSRLYASGGWRGGTLISMDKDIVMADGTLEKYSAIGEGAQVTYRLSLENTQNRPFVINGGRFADALPLSVGGVNWQKDVNITDFRYEKQGDVTVYGLENWWIGTEFGALLDDSRQYILWPDETSIQWNGEGTVYLYFTLTYPRNTEGAKGWTDYVEAVRGEKIDNSFYVYRSSREVTHDLLVPGEVLLQKGVSGMYHYLNNGYASYTKAGNSRYYYNNNDSRLRAVLYYVSIYNDSGKRLYLTELQDKLPQGFTFLQMMADSNVESIISTVEKSKITTRGGYNPFGEYPLVELGRDGILYRSASVSANVDENGLLRFTIGKGNGEDSIHFDEELQQCYLNAGEALVFGYTCNTGLSTETSDNAKNGIGMPYVDHLGTGVSTVSIDEMQVTASNSTIFTDFNDGNRQVMSTQQASHDYGFTGTASKWLVSEVTVHRGGIVPGVTKETVSYYNPDTKITQDYKTSVGPKHTVNWRVTLHNSGTLSLTDYTFTDIMPAPYVFEGPVVFTIKDARGTEMFQKTLLTFPTRKSGETGITVSKSNGYGAAVLLNGEKQVIGVDRDLQMSLHRDADGNEVLRMYCTDADLSIPEGGTVEVTFSSRNPTNSHRNQVYINQATLTPNAQPFDHVGQGSMIRDEDGKPLGATNYSPVTVSFGYATTSEKKVEEKDEEGTVRSSASAGGYILLSDPSKPFTYTLTVENSTDQPMTKLVLIDSLPQPGDCSPFDVNVKRSSEYTVDLLTAPVVIITPEKGEPYSLDSQYYRVEYSTGMDFGGPESKDWMGETQGTTADWTAALENARAFRVVILDDDGLQLPAKCKISVSFDAKAGSDAAFGEAAWNSFGYHYGLKGVSVELEAMPLGVGVKMPNFPTLEKRLVDAQGGEAEAGEAVPCVFRITREKLEGEAEAASITKTVVVPQEESTSGTVSLMEQGEFWQKGLKYTVTEETVGEDYTFFRFQGGSSASYTFAYDPVTSQRVVCENAVKNWSVALTKTDPTGNPLAGAVFGLYSPDDGEALDTVPDSYDGVIYPNGDKEGWYLMDVGTTAADGKLTFDGLTQEGYYLAELKAPDGYQLPKNGQFLNKANSENNVYSLIIKNHATYELPQTGGTGTGWFRMSGTVLVMLAGWLYLVGHRRRSRI